MFRVIVHNVSLLRFRSLDFIHAFISWETVAVRRLSNAADRASPWMDGDYLFTDQGGGDKFLSKNREHHQACLQAPFSVH